MSPFVIDTGTAQILCGLLMLLGTIAVAWMTSRTSKKAASQVADVDQRKVDQEAFDRITEKYEELARKAEERARQAEEHAESLHRRLSLLEANLSAHERWDAQVLSVVRRIDPDFPAPPPLTITDDPTAA